MTPTPAEVFRERRRRATENLLAEGVDALLITDLHNVAYLTGFAGDSSYLLLSAHSAQILSDARYEEQIELECPGLDAYIRRPGETQVQSTAKALERFKAGNVAFESNALTVATFGELREQARTVSWKPTAGRIEKLRAVKDDHELAALREAVGIAEAAFAATMANVDPERSEKDLADELEFAMRRRGAKGASFPTIVGYDRTAGLPHAIAGGRIGRGSELLLVDWGAKCAFYQSDCTRTVAVGAPTARFKQVYTIVLEAQRRAIAAIRPGAKGCDVDAAARNYISEAGFGQEFGHGLGHGVGLQIHEAPALRPESTAVLEVGMVVTVEPGIYLKGWGGVRLEDMVVVTDNGCESLTAVPKGVEETALPAM